MGMTPDEHYREAERYLGKWRDYNELAAAEGVVKVHPTAPPEIASMLAATGYRHAANLLAAAQVHATLATLGKRAES